MLLLFLSYPRTSIPLILSVLFVTGDEDTGIVFLSGEFTVAEFRALVRGAMDIESMTRTMAPRTRARNSAAVNSPDKTMIPVLLSSVTNGLEGIDGINVRG